MRSEEAPKLCAEFKGKLFPFVNLRSRQAVLNRQMEKSGTWSASGDVFATLLYGLLGHLGKAVVDLN